jgi:nickel/cobalt exporter
LFWAGMVSTLVMGLGTAITVASIATLAVGAKGIAKRFAHERGGYGGLLLRGMETGAAAVVLIFGVLLLAGYMASERLVGF